MGIGEADPEPRHKFKVLELAGQVLNGLDPVERITCQAVRPEVRRFRQFGQSRGTALSRFATGRDNLPGAVREGMNPRGVCEWTIAAFLKTMPSNQYLHNSHSPPNVYRPDAQSPARTGYPSPRLALSRAGSFVPRVRGTLLPQGRRPISHDRAMVLAQILSCPAASLRPELTLVFPQPQTENAAELRLIISYRKMCQQYRRHLLSFSKELAKQSRA
jgi:hypothetical protein